MKEILCKWHVFLLLGLCQYFGNSLFLTAQRNVTVKNMTKMTAEWKHGSKQQLWKQEREPDGKAESEVEVNEAFLTLKAHPDDILPLARPVP